HCRCGRGICHVGVVRGADDPELAPAVLEKAHRGEREIRVGREATKLRLELVERRAEYRFADRPTLGESDRARDGGGNRGDAADLRLLLDDDDLGRQELSAHDAPRFFLALTSARLTSTEVVTVGARVEATTGREGSGTWRFTPTPPRFTARTTSGTASTASWTSGLVTPPASVREVGMRLALRPVLTSHAHAPRALQYVSWVSTNTWQRPLV